MREISEMDVQANRAATAVARGAELLDHCFNGENWAARVDLDELMLDSSRWCVLGQLFHAPGRKRFGYDLGLRALFGGDFENRKIGSLAAGFCGSSFGMNAQLELAWRNLIEERLNET